MPLRGAYSLLYFPCVARNLLTVTYHWATGYACQDPASEGTNPGTTALSSGILTKGNQFPSAPEQTQ